MESIFKQECCVTELHKVYLNLLFSFISKYIAFSQLTTLLLKSNETGALRHVARERPLLPRAPGGSLHIQTGLS